MLKQFAEIITKSIRSSDSAARFGGDEFIILLENTGRRLQAHRPDRKLAQLEERVQRLSRAMQLQAGRLVQSHREKLANLARTLHAVSPLETLGRGYAVVTDSASGTVVSSVSGVEPGDGVTAQLSDGLLDCTVTGKRET